MYGSLVMDYTNLRVCVRRTATMLASTHADFVIFNLVNNLTIGPCVTSCTRKHYMLKLQCSMEYAEGQT